MKSVAAAMIAALGFATGAAQPTPAEPASPAQPASVRQPASDSGPAFVTPGVEQPLKAAPGEAIETVVSEVGPAVRPADGTQPIVRNLSPLRIEPVESPAPADTVSPDVASALSSEIGWVGTIEARPSAVMPATNWIYQTRPILPRVSRPERRGFGGFMAAFANLFNPLAPVEEGTATSAEHWYDSQINIGPLPRVMRDERYHEPTTQILRVGLEERREARE